MWGRESIYCTLLLFQGNFFQGAVKYNRIRRMRCAFLQEMGLLLQLASPGNGMRAPDWGIGGTNGIYFFHFENGGDKENACGGAGPGNG
jgi:hypothetical protein